MAKSDEYKELSDNPSFNLIMGRLSEAIESDEQYRLLKMNDILNERIREKGGYFIAIGVCGATPTICFTELELQTLLKDFACI